MKKIASFISKQATFPLISFKTKSFSLRFSHGFQKIAKKHKMEPISLKTAKLYLEDSYLSSISGCTVTQTLPDPSDPLVISVLFDKTIFHPQGGGQPSDTGVLIGEGEGNWRVAVKELGYDKERDNVLHKVKLNSVEESQNFLPGAKFSMEIDEKRRKTNAKLHSAGHLLDVAVKELGLDWIPGKGFHFEESPYVEYIGKMPGDEKIKDLLTEKCNNFINKVPKEDIMRAKVFEYGEIGTVMASVPEYLPKDKPIRFVKLFVADPGCPCGGTHVKHVGDIGNMKVTKFTKKGKNVRVSYVVD